VDRHRRDAFAAMHPHVRTDLPDFLTPEVAEPAKEVLTCHSKTITESSSVLDVLWPAVEGAPLISRVPGVRGGDTLFHDRLLSYAALVPPSRLH